MPYDPPKPLIESVSGGGAWIPSDPLYIGGTVGDRLCLQANDGTGVPVITQESLSGALRFMPGKANPQFIMGDNTTTQGFIDVDGGGPLRLNNLEAGDVRVQDDYRFWGSVPSSPVDGDFWAVGSSLFARLGGRTVELGAGALPPLQEQIELADLPAALTTGTVTFGTIPANRLLMGGLIYLAALDVGASGITSLKLNFGIADAGAPADAYTVVADINLIGETPGAYLHAGDVSLANEFLTGLGAVRGSSAVGFYSLTAIGGNLDQLTAFDITLLQSQLGEELAP